MCELASHTGALQVACALLYECDSRCVHFQACCTGTLLPNLQVISNSECVFGHGD
jgi:hypothetical protein